MNPIAQKVLTAIETEIEALIESKSDELVQFALDKIAAKIPGGFDDAFLAGIAPEVKAAVKEELLKAAAKIDGQ